MIFISIDDHEIDNLRKLGNEVFGEENFIATIVWRKKITPDARQDIDPTHDYVVAYARSASDLAAQETFGIMPLSEERKKSFKNPDNDPRGPWASVDMTGMTGRATKDQFFSVTLPSGRVIGPPPGRSWGLAPATFEKLRKDGRIWFGKDGDSVPRIKRYLSEAEGQNSATWWPDDQSGTTESARKALLSLIGTPDIFDFPKPVELLTRLTSLVNDPAAIVLDFFAGSGTTAQAVMELNAGDGGNRKFMLVQLPEPCEEGSAAYKAGLKTIAAICKERVRRVIKKLNGEDAGSLHTHSGAEPDRGFRVFKLAESNFTTWDAQAPQEPATLLAQLEKHVEHIRKGRTPQDILYELLLKSGFPLTTPVETQAVAGKTIYRVAGGALVICLEGELTPGLIRSIAAMKPQRVVCLDGGFAGNDQLKANAVQTFKAQGVISFKTV